MVAATRNLALSLATRSMDEEDNNTKSTEEFPLSLDDECILLEEHVEDALSGYEALKKLETQNINVRLFTAHQDIPIKR